MKCLIIVFFELWSALGIWTASLRPWKGDYFKKKKTFRIHLVHWINVILRIVIFITEIIKYYNKITITIHKFGCYIWKARKRWWIKKIYIFENILILKLIICTKDYKNILILRPIICTKDYINFKEELHFLNLTNNYSFVIPNPCNEDATKWPNYYYTWITIPLHELLHYTKHTLSERRNDLINTYPS